MQAPGETTYHIFYYLCAACVDASSARADDGDGAPSDYVAAAFLRDLHLADGAESFHYTNQGGANVGLDAPDLLQRFDKIQALFDYLGFKQAQQESIFKILAAVLHLGNITIPFGNVMHASAA